MFFIFSILSTAACNLVSLMRTDVCVEVIEVISLLQMLQIVSLCRWQRAVRSSLHIKQMYGETQHWREASDLSHQAV